MFLDFIITGFRAVVDVVEDVHHELDQLRSALSSSAHELAQVDLTPLARGPQVTVNTKITWHGAKAKAAVQAGAARGLMLAAEHVLEEARRIVPHELGDLEKDSCASIDEGGKRAAVTFGYGAAAAYAVSQHENLTFQHDPGRQAKYLETALNAARADGSLLKIIGDEVRRSLRS